MRVSPTLVIVMMFWGPAGGSAQDKTIMQSACVAPNAAVVNARPTLTVADVDTDRVAFKRLLDAFYRRLQPIQLRVDDDQRLRSAGAVLGLGAVALGAIAITISRMFD